ncbi:RNA pseudouridylate synthase domain-containing protein 2 isoform X3 [Drosophila grimshawi]|uniref:Pseudouridylate synthase RPUSD2 n=2 Tax=Drosophila grimshawi TaxID=7222 RepID=B4JQ05_DROGR|nr:RNA pseudouridylate synthase domain-containing protein 2 isoform X3 [Drosophila grimshawi]EDV98985.1 GH13297 [Drosophila grimshawi]
MTLPKTLRHVQTQHGDGSVDVENIFLFRANLNSPNNAGGGSSTNAAEAEAETENETGAKTEADNEAKAEKPNSLSGVWTFEASEEDCGSQLATVAEESGVHLPEKRKTPQVEEIVDAKRPKLETKDLKLTRPGFSEERYEETSYYIENGLRKVYPYSFTFTTFTKGRWVGEGILNVFSREFRAHPAEEYKRSIEAGSLTVNHEKVPIDYRLKHNDLLANTVHRHEVPVTAHPITIVHMDDDILVVNKPASIPVHPCGRYRHNTMIFILAKEFNMRNLRTIHRLDRLTSGLLLFGRTAEKAREMEQQIRNRQVQKEYVCCVEGCFPDGNIECNEPIEVVSYKIGVCKVSPKGKDCKTTFKRLGQVGDYSIVQCKPLTGRMHQIRVHLQYLGYPIVNDPLYNHEVFGPLKGRGGDIGGKSDDQLIRDLISIHNAENWLGIDGAREVSTNESLKVSENTVSRLANTDSNSELKTEIKSSPEAKVTVSTQTGHEAADCSFDHSKLSVDPHCQECRMNYRDPKPADLVMYLHAWKYKGIGWEYTTELPNWASIEGDNCELSLRDKRC